MCQGSISAECLVTDKRIGNCPIEDMFKWLLPLLGVLVAVLMLITYIPPLTMFLPSLL